MRESYDNDGKLGASAEEADAQYRRAVAALWFLAVIIVLCGICGIANLTLTLISISTHS